MYYFDNGNRVNLTPTDAGKSAGYMLPAIIVIILLIIFAVFQLK
jgi:hypothetical protein